MRLRRLLTVSLATVLTASTGSLVSAAIIHVPGDQPTIQAGIDAATTGDSVLVAPGTYSGPGNRDLTFGGRSIRVESTGGPATTVIDCEGLSPGITASEESPTIVGFTITGATRGFVLTGGPNLPTIATLEDCVITSCSSEGVFLMGSFSGPEDRATLRSCVIDGSGGIGLSIVGVVTDAQDCEFTNNDGGGVRVADVDEIAAPGSLELDDCLISGNGGIGCEARTTSTLHGCTIEGHGSGRGFVQATGQNSTVTLTECVLRDNQQGGALVMGLDSEFIAASFFDCTFEGNSAERGGAVELRIEERQGAMSGCSFIGNTATGSEGGGAIYFIGIGDDERQVIDDCDFIDNAAPVGAGGAIRLGDDSFQRGTDILGCVFAENSAAIGGAIYKAGFEISVPTDIESCTFHANTASVGGAIALDTTIPPDVPRVSISSSIIAGSTAGEALFCSTEGASPIISISCSNLFDNAGGDYVGCAAPFSGQNGNISADPEFCDPDVLDLRLMPSSPSAPPQSACGLMGARPVGCIVTAMSDLDAPVAPRRLHVHPNPVTTHATLTLGDRRSGVSVVEIYSPSGRLVERLRTRGDVRWSPAPGTPRGLYLVRLVGEGGVEETAKLLLVH